VSTKPESVEAVKAPPKRKKLLVVAGLAIVVLVVAGAGGWFYLSKQQASEDGEEAVAHVETKGPPSFFPLENMVVNLADPGGAKVVQIGITLELLDAHSADKIKAYLPTIRSNVLLLISQRTSEVLLQREGKEKLAVDILAEASRPFGAGDAVHASDEAIEKIKAKKKNIKTSLGEENPVRGVLFSSFIIQ
jgi:flagellar protein FliL